MADLIVRNPTPGEVERAAEIAAIAFPHLPLEHWQRSFNTIANMFGERFILVVEADGQLVSSMVCTPGPIYVGDGVVSHSAVGAVGTISEYRKQRCAGVMMAESVRLLRAERMYTSSLWPFSYKYYRKFGWELGSEMRSYRADADVFEQLGDASKTRPSTIDDLEGIMVVYDEFAHNYNCLTQRTSEWWLDVINGSDWLRPGSESGAACLVHLRDGSTDGYAMYYARTPSEGEQQKVEVKELVFDEPLDRRDLLAGLAGLFPGAAISFGAPADDTFIHELEDPWSVGITITPSHMFRVIDPPQAMLSLRGEAHVDGRLSLSISDPVFEQGFQFGLEVAGGRASLCEFELESALEMDVQTLAKLYTGCLTPLQAWYLGSVNPRGDTIRDLTLAGYVFSTLTPHRSWLEPG